jgi:hypothetical protein
MSTLDGTYTPAVGDLVWEQLYSPQEPHWRATIEERVAGGVLYGTRHLMRIAGITLNYDATDYARSLGAPTTGEPRTTTRWWLVHPDQPNNESLMSWVESDWCVLESAATDNGMLF